MSARIVRRSRQPLSVAPSTTRLWSSPSCVSNRSRSSTSGATPTVSGGKVYSLGAEGNLLCLSADKGAVLWQKDLKQEYKIDAPMWGFTGHPLVDGQKLICLVGGTSSLSFCNMSVASGGV